MSFLSSSHSVVQPRNALNFFAVTGKLKTLKRTGWVDNDPAVNKDRLVKVCLVHDLAEAEVGDITPHAGVSKADKRILEETALKQIIADIGHQEIGAELLSLWLEYEEGTTLEAELARQLDKFEMIVQANEYELVHPDKRLDSFFRSTQDCFFHPEIVTWNALLREDRDKRLAAFGTTV